MSNRNLYSLDYYLAVVDLKITKTFYSSLILFSILTVSWFSISKFGIFHLIGTAFSAIFILDAFFFIPLRNYQFFLNYPQPLQVIVKHIYSQQQNTIQYDPRCFRYDDELTYIFKPGQCTHQNLEFSNTYQINSLGLRDDEVSLKDPEIIFIGDSLTMGWGVEQNETFSQLVEKAVDKKTLNAGVASYGTVRELKLLDRINTKNTKVLAIQYDENDAVENLTFKNLNARLPVSSNLYDYYVKKYAPPNDRYFFGKYTFLLLELLWENFSDKLEKKFIPSENVEEHHSAEYFLFAFTKASTSNLSNLKILILSPNKWFSKALKELLNTGNYPLHLKNASILEVEDIVTKDYASHDYYVFDNHMTKQGHAVLAKSIVKWLENNPLIFSSGDSSSQPFEHASLASQ